MTLYDYKNDLIQLVPVNIEDAEAIMEFAGNPNVKRYIGWQLKETKEQTVELIELMQSRQEAKTHIYASVQENATGKIIGTLMLFGFDWEAGHGEIGYVFHEAVWGKGYGTAATRLACEYVFNELNLRKLYARVVNVNVGSARVLEKNQFTLEATLKDYYFIDHEHCDCQYYSRVSDQV